MTKAKAKAMKKQNERTTDTFGSNILARNFAILLQGWLVWLWPFAFGGRRPVRVFPIMRHRPSASAPLCPPMPWLMTERFAARPPHCTHSTLSSLLLCHKRPLRMPLTSTHHHNTTQGRSPNALPASCSSPLLQKQAPKTMRAVLPALCLCLSYAAAFMPATPASALRGECLSPPPFLSRPRPISFDSWRHPFFFARRCLNSHTTTHSHSHTLTYALPQTTQPPPPLLPGEGGPGLR